MTMWPASRLQFFLPMALALCVALATSRVAFSLTQPQPAQAITGAQFDYVVRAKDSLRSISSRFGVARNVLRNLNHLKPEDSVAPGQIVHIDNRHIPPGKIDRGLLINVPQRMLFFFDGGHAVSAYPVAVGKSDWETELGSFTVIRLEKNPTWSVPPSIQDEMEDEGLEVRDSVPPGPDNPLGNRAIHLSMPGYLVHGTNRPLSIYGFRTHGCIRLHPDDVRALYDRLKVGDPGQIVYQPALLASLPDGRVFVEVSRDVYHYGIDATLTVRHLAETANVSDRIDWNAIGSAINQHDGIAIEVDIPDKRPTPSPFSDLIRRLGRLLSI
jgi:L,D-transpeptidase ErfK/SrfK